LVCSGFGIRHHHQVFKFVFGGVVQNHNQEAEQKVKGKDASDANTKDDCLKMFKILGGIGNFSAEFVFSSHNPEVYVCNIAIVKEVNFLKSGRVKSHFVHVRHHHIQNFIQSATVIDVAVFYNDLLTLKK
jgi:hypothetical protein